MSGAQVKSGELRTKLLPVLWLVLVGVNLVAAPTQVFCKLCQHLELKSAGMAHGAACRNIQSQITRTA
jgi:hypothetical protein